MEYLVELVQNPVSVPELLPTYRYQFQDVPIPNESSLMYDNLIEFLKENEELLIENTSAKDAYVQGFKKALAVTRLWMDSLYVEQSDFIRVGENDGKKNAD